MADSSRPGPGRSTSDAAVSELKKEIARRNEDAQKAARKLRAERERKLLAQRREWDGPLIAGCASWLRLKPRFPPLTRSSGIPDAGLRPFRFGGGVLAPDSLRFPRG